MIKQQNANRPLRLPLKMGISKTSAFDFERLRYLGVPKLKNTVHAVSANRDDRVKVWFQVFRDHNEYTDQTKNGFLHDFVKYVKCCDQHNVGVESDIAVEIWERHLITQVRNNSLSVNSAR